MPIKILGVRIDDFTKKKALEKVAEFLQSNKQHIIFTPNPEMLVDAQTDEEFRNILNSGSLNICDGFGIKVIAKGKVTRIPGIDFMLDICGLAKRQEKSVYLLGSGDQNVVEKVKENLSKKFPKLRIIGSNPGPKITMEPSNSAGRQWNNGSMQIDVDREENDQISYDITTKTPDILFVAFGHIKQEKWIHQYLKELPSVKVAMGVGGSFDYIAEKVKRAPKWMQGLGLEWLYRLLKEPKRIKRIWKATGVFLYLVIKNQSKSVKSV